MFLKRLTFGDEARNKKHLSKNQKLRKEQVKLLLNPSDPDLIFHTCPPRGGVITPPLVKSIFPIEIHVFPLCCEILQKLCYTLKSITKISPNFDDILHFTG